VSSTLVCDIPGVFLTELFGLSEVLIGHRVVNVVSMLNEATLGGIFRLRWSAFHLIPGHTHLLEGA
jgi:hypothetical protein